MDVGVIGAGIAGLTAAWWLRRAGHRVMVFERNYKPGGRMNSRRKAGLVVDHGQRYLASDSAVLRGLIRDCGLQGDLRPIERPILDVAADGSYIERADSANSPRRMVFPDGMLVLPESLRRTLGGFYSMGVTKIERDEETGKFLMHTEPPMRLSETQVDAVIVACAAPEALRIAEPVRAMLHAPFLEKLGEVRYNRCIVLIAALNEVQSPRDVYALRPPAGPEAALRWLAFESRKCEGRAVEGWTSIVAHATAEYSERIWDEPEETILYALYKAASAIAPELPPHWRWARSKRWEIAHLKGGDEATVPHNAYPAAPQDVLLEFCGDYRLGDGVERAAQSGLDAAERLHKKADRDAKKSG